jgi:hypothetical protein
MVTKLLSRILGASLLVCALSIPLGGLFAQDKNPGWRDLETDARQREIEMDLRKKHKEPWEAVFYGSWNKDATTLIISKKGYVMKRYRLPSDRGSVMVEKNQTVKLVSEISPRLQPRQFAVVEWGGRCYLIESDRIVEFCNAVNFGVEPRAWGAEPFLLRFNDWEKEVTGLPSVAKEYQSYLTSKPIIARVLQTFPYRSDVAIPIRPGKWDGIPVSIDVGEQGGVRVGMRFCSKRMEPFATGYVFAVEKSTARVLVTSFPYGKKEFLAPGFELSTRLPSRVQAK